MKCESRAEGPGPEGPELLLSSLHLAVASRDLIQYNTLFLVDLSDLRIRFNTKPSLVYQSSSELRGRTPASDRPPIPAQQVY